MELDVKISYSWENYCRLCLLDTGVMVPIFEEEGVKRQLVQKIEICFQLLTYDGDPLPKRICHKCLAKLNQAYDFRLKVMESFSKLNKHLQPFKDVGPIQAYMTKAEALFNFRVPAQNPFFLGSQPDSSIGAPELQIKSEADVMAPHPPETTSPFAPSMIPQLESTRISTPKDSVSNLFLHPSIVSPVVPVETSCSPVKKSLIENTSEPYASSHCSEAQGNETQKRKRSASDSGCELSGVRKKPAISDVVRKRPLVGPASYKKAVMLRNKQKSHVKVSYKCTQCMKEFSTVEDKAVHEANCHVVILASAKDKNLPYCCSMCASRFASKHMLQMHMNQNHDEELKTPVKSKKDAPLKSFVARLKDDERESEVNKVTCNSDVSVFPCTVCDRVFSERHHLEAHSWNHDALNYKCWFCNCVYATRNTLRLHESVEHADKQRGKFQCKICKEYFDSRSSLFLHKNIHKTETGPQKRKKTAAAFQCQICQVDFHSDNAFVWHLYKHALGDVMNQGKNEKLHNGEANDRSRENEELAPIKASDEELNFKCDQCDVVYNSKDRFNAHVAKHRSRTKSRFPCSACKQKFRNVKALNTHTCPGNEVGSSKGCCLDCGQAFVVGEDHECDNKCPHCNKVFKSAKGQRSHALQKHGVDLEDEPLDSSDNESPPLLAEVGNDPYLPNHSDGTLSPPLLSPSKTIHNAPSNSRYS